MEGITCPYCKFEHKNWQDYGLDGGDMEGSFEMPCEQCKKTFNVKFKINYEFNTTKEVEMDKDAEMHIPYNFLFRLKDEDTIHSAYLPYCFPLYSIYMGDTTLKMSLTDIKKKFESEEWVFIKGN